MPKFTTLEAEIALMSYLDTRRNIVVPNVSWGMQLKRKALHECDLLVLSGADYATEIEIKISRADLLKDKHKPHKHKHNLIKSLMFAVPIKLKELALKEIPERAGLFTIESTTLKGKIFWRVVVVKDPVPNKSAVKWTQSQRQKLLRLGTLRILGLKKQILKLKQAAKK